MARTPAPTVPAATSHAAVQSANLAGFLRFAEDYVVPQVGSIPSGASGPAGGNWSPVDAQIPIIPAYCDRVTLEVTLPFTVTTGAGGATVSPLAPYSSVLMQLMMAGAQPWPLMSCVPWHLDDITSRRNWDPAWPGPYLTEAGGTYGSIGDANTVPREFDPFLYDDGGLHPGAAIAASTTKTGTIKFRVVVRLQRNPKLAFGLIPFGDPENRPRMVIQLANLVGSNPESCLVVDTTGATTASLTAAATVNVTYRAKRIDTLPPGVASIPVPTVGMGLTVAQGNRAIQNAGQIIPLQQQTAMLYEKVQHLVVVGGGLVAPDYMGLWLTGEQNSARHEYDASRNTLNAYYEGVHRRYGRLLPRGHFVEDFESGENPDDPMLTPLRGYMSPDVGYAAQFGINPTPAMATALRVPSGTSITSPSYAAWWEFGLVNVPY